MKHFSTLISKQTNNRTEIIDLTSEIKDIVKTSGIKEGLVHIFVKHTTAGIRINETETGLLKDIEEHLQRIVPEMEYHHDNLFNRNCPPDERINGHAHLKSLFLNSSETIPLENNQLALGKWQAILFLELDGNRSREIMVQIWGE